MKALITLSLLMMITLSAQSQTYEKIKAAYPSEMYKSHEKEFSEFLSGVKSKDGRDLGYLALKFYAEGYYKYTFELLNEILDDVTPAKVNRIVGKFIASEEFMNAFHVIEMCMRSKDRFSIKERLEKLDYNFSLSIEGAELLGLKGSYYKYIEGIIERAYIKAQRISL